MMRRFALSAVLAVALVGQVAQAKPPQKITGGEFAAPGEFPYQVSLRVDGEHSCGAAIIGSRHIITAAHCVTELNIFQDVVVVTGSTNRFGGQTHIPKAVYYHGDYTHENDGPNDIAVISLRSPIKFNAYQNKIDLPLAPTATGELATVTGWGYLSAEDDTAVENLRKLEVRTISAAKCQDYMSSVLHDHQICTFAAYGLGTCSGDSGGPLAADGRLIGIVSYGVPCSVGVPDVYSSVYHHVEWIKNVIALP